MLKHFETLRWTAAHAALNFELSAWLSTKKTAQHAMSKLRTVAPEVQRSLSKGIPPQLP